MPSSWADWASVRVVSASMFDSPVSKVGELLHTELPYTVEEYNKLITYSSNLIIRFIK